jgi:hypothetical protein
MTVYDNEVVRERRMHAELQRLDSHPLAAFQDAYSAFQGSQQASWNKFHEAQQASWAAATFEEEGRKRCLSFINIESYLSAIYWM